MITRDKVLAQGIEECYRAMYSVARPKVDYDELVKLHKEGKEDEKHPFYRQYYIPNDLHNEILDEYRYAYGADSTWYDYVEVIEDAFKKGLVKYGKDEDGMLTTKKIPSLEETIGKENTEKVLELLDECKHYYRFNRDEHVFNFNVCLGCSPTSNKEEVIEYWKKQGVDVEIDDEEIRNEYYGYDYGEDDDCEYPEDGE